MDARPAQERFPCPGCSAAMEFDPQTGGLKCPYCGLTQAVSHPVNQEVRELDFERHGGGDDPAILGKLSEAALQVSCTSCGSTVEFEPATVAGSCSFCAASIVMQPKAADPLIAPNGVLPFALPRQTATASVRQWLASRWFAPGGLKNVTKPEGIRGVYIPFWTFDAHAESDYQGARGDHYYETETVMVNQNGRQVPVQRQVRKTRWSSASGSVTNDFDDLLIAATRSIDRQRLHDLDPWDLQTVAPYEPAFLAGFQAQRYQIDPATGLEEAKGMMRPVIEYAVRRDIGGDEQQIHHLDTSYSGITFKHVLLPVWIGAYRFQSKVYQVIVNARTGEVQGERPYSAAKIALLIVAILVLALILKVAASD